MVVCTFCAIALLKQMRDIRSRLRDICAPIDLAANLHSLSLEAIQLPYSAARPQASRRKSNEQVLEP
jgi:hypothetical protein